jgi:NAD(P)-dependent dehydrogenase (short-subunit alcohol dehydrogenase family)
MSEQKGASIFNTTSVTAYRGSPALLDYSSTKGAIVAFTRSLSANLAEQGIRVNAVLPARFGRRSSQRHFHLTSEQAAIVLKRRRIGIEHAWHLQKLGYVFDRFEPVTGVYVLANTVQIRSENGVVGFSMLRSKPPKKHQREQ